MKLGTSLSRTERVWVLRLLRGSQRLNGDPPAVKRLVNRGLASERRECVGFKTGRGPVVIRHITITPSGVLAAGAL